MNSEKLYKIAGEIDDRFVSETMRPKASPRVRRWLGAAAAVLLIAGAVPIRRPPRSPGSRR